MKTLTQASPPIPPNNKKTLVEFPDDEIREIGDRIAQLSKKEAKDLSNYLNIKEDDNEPQQNDSGSDGRRT